MTRAIDRRLLCQCRKLGSAYECQYRASAEDMLCNTCRAGCSEWCQLGAEDMQFHLAPGSIQIDWADLDSDLL